MAGCGVLAAGATSQWGTESKGGPAQRWGPRGGRPGPWSASGRGPASPPGAFPGTDVTSPRRVQGLPLKLRGPAPPHRRGRGRPRLNGSHGQSAEAPQALRWDRRALACDLPDSSPGPVLWGEGRGECPPPPAHHKASACYCGLSLTFVGADIYLLKEHKH